MGILAQNDKKLSPTPPDLFAFKNSNLCQDLSVYLTNRKWQLKNSFFVLLIFYASLYPLFVTVFTTYAPEHRCHIEQCDIDNQTVNTEWLSYAIPNQESSNTFLSELQTYDSCRRFQRIDEGTVNNFAYFSLSYKVSLQTTEP